jgi:hypothetical protein
MPLKGVTADINRQALSLHSLHRYVSSPAWAMSLGITHEQLHISLLLFYVLENLDDLYELVFKYYEYQDHILIGQWLPRIGVGCLVLLLLCAHKGLYSNQLVNRRNSSCSSGATESQLGLGEHVTGP